MNTKQPNPDGPDLDPTPTPAAGDVKPWEEIAEGRYMPRRIRGSCVGRELG